MKSRHNLFAVAFLAVVAQGPLYGQPASARGDKLSHQCGSCWAFGASQLTYKNYLFPKNDAYSCDLLRANLCPAGATADLECVSHAAVQVCDKVMALNMNGMTLNDSYNETIVVNQGKVVTELGKVSTLFAPLTMTYDPDAKDQIGWPMQDLELQKKGQALALAKSPSCLEYKTDDTTRFSPYTSHCSAYVAWATQKVFGVNLYPTQVGDWCHVAAEQRDRMFNDKANWRKIDSTGAVKSANRGLLVLAAMKKLSSAPAHQQNGHIAVVLPITKLTAKQMQAAGDNYPPKPTLSSVKEFETFIRLYGPEVSQAGGLNFNHTVTANAFSSYYKDAASVGTQPIDQIVDFFEYNHKTQIQFAD